MKWEDGIGASAYHEGSKYDILVADYFNILVRLVRTYFRLLTATPVYILHV